MIVRVRGRCLIEWKISLIHLDPKLVRAVRVKRHLKICTTGTISDLNFVVITMFLGASVPDKVAMIIFKCCSLCLSKLLAATCHTRPGRRPPEF